ncbi:serine hydrolase [Flavihumibacter rivuli]|uniref:serine hydrolase n=1 Tax=Flavihumibacter rivuli TaxID=2838156 RepID=UPI001BDE5167|nr:serine hydrolase [Flavihumibacter rivuli]ULQ58383.1 serine hydrolase [Flavihumibacter rivuli]
MKQLLTICLALLLGLNLFGQPVFDIPRLDSQLNLLHQQHRFNGVVLYAEKGKVKYSKAFGVADIRNGQALTTKSSFNLASVTKQFVCMGILILAEKGKLQVDDDVRKYIPELPYNGITIRNLMTHTSGIPEYFDLFMRYRSTLDTLDNEGMIRLFAERKPALDFETGTKWNYCNTNYVLLSSIIERVSGQNFAAFFQQQIARPLGLKDTYVYNVKLPSSPANRVFGFREQDGRTSLEDLTVLDGVTGDGNIYSSAEDLLKWDQALYAPKLVKASTLAEAFKPVKLKNDSTFPYGFGWRIEQEGEMVSHTGGWVGFVNEISRDIKNNRTLIVLSNGSNGTVLRATKAMFTGKPFSFPSSQLISNVELVDGTGTGKRKAAVRILGERITAVGELQPFPGEEVIDGGGRILAPGFIDTHSHLEGSLKKQPDAIAALNQGITTIVAGQDGGSSFIDSIKLDMVMRPVAINVATYTGQTTLREMVMGESQLNRKATDEEIGKMQAILKEEMKKGSLGLSTGLEYAGAYFSSKDEVIRLAQVAAEFKGRYMSHLRSEDIALNEAIDEIIEIGREARLPVQISHIKIALKDVWGTASNLVARLQAARARGVDITADCYPYDFWHSTLKVLFPKTDYTNLASAEYAVNHTFDPSGSVLARFAPNPSYKGKTISEIAAMRKETPAQTIMGLIAEADAFRKKYPDTSGVETIMGKSMTEGDIISFLNWAHTNICSDGAIGGHPRAFGSFTRVLGYYVREKKIMSLEQAIHKMTGLAAEQVGIAERGVIVPGFYADLVLLDPATVRDNASIQQPSALSDGIELVWVNGKIVYKGKQPTRVYPGRFVSRKP